MTRTNTDTKWLIIATVLTLPLSFISIIGSLLVIVPHSRLIDKITETPAMYRLPPQPLKCMSERDFPLLLDAPVNTFLDNPHLCLEFNDTTSIYSFETLTRNTHPSEAHPHMTELRMKSGESVRVEVADTYGYLNFSVRDSKDKLIREKLLKMPERLHHRNLQELSESGLLFRSNGRSPAAAPSPAMNFANGALFGSGGGSSGGLMSGFGNGDAIRSGFRGALMGSNAQGMQPSYMQPSYNPYGGMGGMGMGGMGMGGLRPTGIYNPGIIRPGAPTYPSYPTYPNTGAPSYPHTGTPTYPNTGAPNTGTPTYPHTIIPSYPTYPNQGTPTYPNQGTPTYPNQGTPTYPNQGTPTYPNQGTPTYPNGAAPPAALPYMPFASKGEQPVMKQFSHQYTKVPSDGGKPVTQQHYYSSLLNPTQQNVPKNAQEFGFDPDKQQQDFTKQFEDMLGGMQDMTNPWASYDMGDEPNSSSMDI